MPPEPRPRPHRSRPPRRADAAPAPSPSSEAVWSVDAGSSVDAVRSSGTVPSVEAGFIAVEWLVAVVFLLIPALLLGAGITRWPERQQVGRAAAAEAARAAVLSDTQAEAFALANQVADDVASNYGVPTGEISVVVESPVWDWGQDVTVTVTVAMPALDVPFIGAWSPGTWSTSSTQRIENYRGLE